MNKAKGRVRLGIRIKLIARLGFRIKYDRIRDKIDIGLKQKYKEIKIKLE
jgi:hypothetical protein